MFTFLQDKSEEREMNNYLDWQNSCQQLLQQFPNMLALEKKLKQTMKFQVLAVWCGIALSLSGL